jgi:hypothetical protein
MKKIAILLFSFLFLIVFSSHAYAYQIFNQNPTFTTNNNGYYIADVFTNSSCFLWWCSNNSYSCFDVQNISGSLKLSNSSRCDYSQTFNSASLTIKMLSDNSYYKMNDGNYLYMESQPNAKWCDQPETSPFGVNPPGYNYTPPVCGGYDYILLPKNKEGIVVLNYTITDNSYLDGQYTVLEVWENGITQLNSTLIWYGGTNQKTLFIPPSNHDRNITVFASWKWYLTPSYYVPVTNITINKFQFYTLDTNEIRTDWTNNHTSELERYCGAGAIIGEFKNINGDMGNTYIISENSTSFVFGDDVNNVKCGFVRLDELIIARHWNFYNPIDSTASNQYNFYTNNLFFIYTETQSANRFVGFFESFLRTQIKMTNLYNVNTTPSDLDYINYDDIFVSKINLRSLRDNYSTAFRQTIDLINNPNISISNSNPSGNKFRFYAEGPIGIKTYSLYYPFFSSLIQVDNLGWHCSDITNSEGYILSNGTEINTLYCGDYGCNAEHTHCNFGFIGTYCSDNTHWAYSDITGIQDTGSCSALCVNKTYGIDCLDNANISYECIDNNGHQVDCQSVKFEAGKIDVASLSCDFGNAAGFSCDGGKFLIGFMLTVLIIGSINGFDYIATKDHKFLPKELNILFLIMLLVGFTIYIPLFNPLLLIIVVIFGVILLASKGIPHITGKSGGEA